MLSEIVDDIPADSYLISTYDKYSFSNLYYSPRANKFYQYDGYVYTIHLVFNYDKRGPCAHVKNDDGKWIKVYVNDLVHN